MNILWMMSECPFPVNSGGKVVISNRLERIAQNHRVYLVSECEDITAEIGDRLDEYCERWYLVKPPHRGIVKQVVDFVIWSNNLGKHKNEMIRAYIKKLLLDIKIDLILIEFPMTYINLDADEVRLKGIPIIINQHNVEFDSVRTKAKVKEISLIERFYSIVESRKLFRFEYKMCKNPNIKAMSFVSFEDKNLYRERINCNDIELVVSPIGANENLGNDISEGIDDYRKKIVFVASLDYGPNVHGVIWFCDLVMPLIREKYNDVALYIVGKDPCRDILKRSDKDVIVLGTVPDVRPFYKSADVIIVPIFFGGGVKTKLIESGLFEKPVVCSSLGCKGTVYRNGHDLIIADDPGEFAKACIDILERKNSVDLGSNMRETTIKYYMWDDIMGDYLAFLSRIHDREEVKDQS